MPASNPWVAPARHSAPLLILGIALTRVPQPVVWNGLTNKPPSATDRVLQPVWPPRRAQIPAQIRANGSELDRFWFRYRFVTSPIIY